MMPITTLDRKKYQGQRQEIFDWCTQTFGPGMTVDAVKHRREDLIDARWALISVDTQNPDSAPICYFFNDEADRMIFSLRWT